MTTPINEELEQILVTHDSKRELNKPSLNRYFTKARLLQLIEEQSTKAVEELIKAWDKTHEPDDVMRSGHVAEWLYMYKTGLKLLKQPAEEVSHEDH